MMSAVYVFLGGGFGCLLRYFLNVNMIAGKFPLSTFIANIFSCFILGILVSYLIFKPSETIKLLFITGFCGGFSTFSSFTLENYQLIKEQLWLLAFGNILLNLLMCMAFLFLGLFLGNAIWGK